jgi:hypothetical protein
MRMDLFKQRLKKTEGAITNEQSRDTDNIGHTRHKKKTNKTQNHNTTQKNNKMSNTNPTKHRGSVHIAEYFDLSNWLKSLLRIY